MPRFQDQSQPTAPPILQLPRRRLPGLWLAAALFAAGAVAAPGAGSQQAQLPFADSGEELHSWTIDRGDDIHGDVDLVGVGSAELRVSPRLRSDTPGSSPLGVYRVIEATDYLGRDVAVSAVTSARDGAFAVVSITVVRRGGGVIESQASQESGGLAEREIAAGLFVPTDATAIIVACRAVGRRGLATFSAVRLETVSYQPQTLDSANVLGRSLSAAPLP